MLAGALVKAGKEALEERRELRLDVLELEVLGIQFVAAVLAVPQKTILLARLALPYL